MLPLAIGHTSHKVRYFNYLRTIRHKKTQMFYPDSLLLYNYWNSRKIDCLIKARFISLKSLFNKTNKEEQIGILQTEAKSHRLISSIRNTNIGNCCDYLFLFCIGSQYLIFLYNLLFSNTCFCRLPLLHLYQAPDGN